MTDSTYDVTIVVPVYNVEPYLQECLDSIAAQTIFTQCEVVIVDDGSTDGSSTIAKQFAAAHRNVVLHRKENGGLGAARNDGIDLAHGRFITFCDSDDVLPPAAMERLRDAMVRDSVTLAIGDMQTFPDRRTAWPWQRYFGKGDRLLTGVMDAPDLVFSASACNKMFDLADLRAAGQRFKEGVHFEDALLVISMLFRASHIALVDELVYLYRKRPTANSIMDNLFTRKQNYWDHLVLVEDLARLRPGLNAFQRNALDRLLIRSFQGFAMRAHALFDEPDLRRIFDSCRKIYADVDPDLVVQWTADSRHQVPYLATKLNDFDLFAHPNEKLRSVVAYDGDLYLDYPVPPALVSLTKSTRTVAQVERIELTPDGLGLQITGRFQISGLPMTAPIENALALRLRGSAITVPAQVQRRADQMAVREDLEWSGFSAVVPVRDLKVGDHSVRLVITTRTGQASTQCLTTAAFLRTSRPTFAGRRRITPISDEHGRATVVVRPHGRIKHRLRWKASLVLKDVKHAVRRGPFWRYRLLRLATAWFMQGRDIWLIGERRDTVQDNSWHLFRYLRTVARRRNVYYVITKGSPDVDRLRGLGHVVWHSSRRHKFLMLHASKLINSYDIDAYMLPEGWSRTAYLRNLAWRTGARRVFLQHGVTHNDVSRGLHRGITGHDLIVAAGTQEAEFLANTLGYGPQAKALGFPRFDQLIPERGRRRVLFMPTWRTYLVAPSYRREQAPGNDFVGSALQTFLTGLLTSERLMDALVRHDYVLEFLPHYEIRASAADLVPANSRISLVDLAERSVQDALRQCDLFVTDWSSTSFDVAYMGTPVVYAEFDAEEFWNGHYRKGYFSAERDGFGPVCRDVEQTVNAIIRYLENGCVREPEYTRRAEAFFAHRDQNNCARVAAAIDAL